MEYVSNIVDVFIWSFEMLIWYVKTLRVHNGIDVYVCSLTYMVLG